MLSTSRKSVVPSNNAGNTENSNGDFTKIVVIRINAANAIFVVMSKSITNGGNGTTITATNPITATGTNSGRYRSSRFIQAGKGELVVRSAMS